MAVEGGLDGSGSMLCRVGVESQVSRSHMHRSSAMKMLTPPRRAES